jgi:hypothetical protein
MFVHVQYVLVMVYVWPSHALYSPIMTIPLTSPDSIWLYCMRSMWSLDSRGVGLSYSWQLDTVIHTEHHTLHNHTPAYYPSHTVTTCYSANTKVLANHLVNRSTTSFWPVLSGPDYFHRIRIHFRIRSYCYKLWQHLENSSNKAIAEISHSNKFSSSFASW